MQGKLTENSIADKLIAAHDGNVALLYIYRSRTGCGDPEQAARDLCLTRREIDAAWEKLERTLGPSAPPRASAPVPIEEKPEYTAEEIMERSRRDPSFQEVLSEAQKILGRVFGSAEITTLFRVYDHYGLPPEVMLMMLHFCGELAENRWGSSRRPTLHFIETEAALWANEEILTLDAAEDYITRRHRQMSAQGRLKAAFSIYDRELTKSEREYISGWLDLGFSEEAILIAYDRTVTKTGGLKWPYMNKILRSWHQMGLHTPREIEERDPSSGKGRAGARSSGKNRPPVDPRELEKTFEKI